MRRLWTAQVLSELGDWAARLALAVLVLDRTGSATLSALVVTFSVAPWALAGPVLAPIGDRFPRRSVMVVADAWRAVAFLALCLPVPIGVVLALTFTAAVATAPFEAARSALLPRIVEPERYGDAIALGSLTAEALIVAGSVVGGVLVATVGARGVLALNAATFALSAAVLVGMRAGRERASGAASSHVRAGISAVVSDPLVRRAVVLFCALAACGTAAESLVAAYVLHHLGASEGVVGLLSGAVSAATVLTGFALGADRPAGHLLRRAARLGGAGGALAAVAFALDPGLPWAVGAYFGLGVLFGASIPCNTVAGRRLPDNVRAAAFGVTQALVMGAFAAGAALGGVLAAATDVRTASVVASAAAATVGAVALARGATRSPAT